MQEDDSSRQHVAPASILFVAPPATAEQNTADTSSGESGQTRSKTGRRRTRNSRPKNEGDTESNAEDSSAAHSSGTQDTEVVRRRTRRRSAARTDGEPSKETAEETQPDTDTDDGEEDNGKARRGRRGRRGRGRGKGGSSELSEAETAQDDATNTDDSESNGEVTRRRRRHRKRAGASENEATAKDGDDTEVVVKVRQGRDSTSDDVQGLSGSTRLEAKRQRRREGRGQRRTRPQVLSESEFLARREAVVRSMVVRGHGDSVQIAVLEDDLLVEHFVTRSGGQGMAGNVYVGKVQNILPSMEAAFIDIGRGRNAVLYAGEVNWDSTGLSGKTRTIEQAMKPGDSVLVQVTKDPVGHKGARLTSHIALSGRHLVYVPHGNSSGISRKLPDSERKRLRSTLKKLVPEGAGVIVRTAAEGAGTEDLERDISRLRAEWERIEAKSTKGNAPTLLHAEPDLLVRVVRDVFNEDFSEIVIDDDSAYQEIHDYLESVSPDLLPRLTRHTKPVDVFADKRVDEQLLKALDRKVYLPSGGSLVVDRTEAMTVIDVNTGKFTGAGGNLEETVTRNNLEAAEEIVRQLRLRDIGGIIVIDFIDMVLESNRELVLRRLTECLGRDRTKHQVTEITSLGLVQMTRKRVGQGLLEAFSEACDHCKGRGVLVHTDPSEKPAKTERAGGANGKGSKKKDKDGKSASKNKSTDSAKSAAEPTRKIAEASAGPTASVA